MRTFLRRYKRFRNEIIMVPVGVVLALLLLLFPVPAERILNIQNYLITVGGIISAFVIAYLRKWQSNKGAVQLTENYRDDPRIINMACDLQSADQWIFERVGK